MQQVPTLLEIVTLQFQGQLHVLQGGEGGEEVVALKDEAHACQTQMGQGGRGQRGDLPALDPDPAGAGLEQTTEDQQQGGLAAPRGSHQGQHLPGMDGEIDLVDGMDGRRTAAIDQGDAGGLQGRGGVSGA